MPLEKEHRTTTVDEALDTFVLQLHADGRSPHTISQYRRHLRTFDSWLAATHRSSDIDKVTPEDIAVFVASRTAGTRPDGTSKRATTVNAIRSSLRTFFHFAASSGLTPTNPTRLLRRALCGTPPPRALSEDETRRLLEALEKAEDEEGRRDRALFRLMLETGLRIGSAVALDIEDLNFDAREIIIRATKGNRPDRVPMPERTRDHLLAWVGQRTLGLLFESAPGRRICVRLRPPRANASASCPSWMLCTPTCWPCATSTVVSAAATPSPASLSSPMDRSRTCPLRHPGSRRRPWLPSLLCLCASLNSYNISGSPKALAMMVALPARLQHARTLTSPDHQPGLDS